MPTSARAVRTIFTEICGEFAGSLRADVGIGPYKVLCRILIAEYSQNEQKQNLLSAIRNCVSTFVGTISYWKGIGLAPEQGAEKSARKRHKSFSSASFCPLFLARQKKYARGATVTVSL